MKNNKKDKSDEERLKRENEERREKLKKETGCDYFISEEGKTLNPAIENQFLNNIEEFDKAFENCKQVAVYDFIGRPVFRKEKDIPDKNIRLELKKIIRIMNKNSISLDTICEVDERELYRFITEELFEHKMDDVRIEGMMNCFTYEEFHPNHRYDIERYCDELIHDLLNPGDPHFEYSVIDTKSGFKERLENFRNSFSGFTVNDYRVISVDFNTKRGEVVFFLDYFAVIDKGTKPLHHSGEGKVGFVYKYGYYYASSVQLPGFKKM